MKTFLILIGLLSLSSCARKELPDEIVPFVKVPCVYQEGNADVYLYTIDSCEYIGYVNDYHDDFLTHKGNCKFCKERKLNDK